MRRVLLIAWALATLALFVPPVFLFSIDSITLVNVTLEAAILFALVCLVLLGVGLYRFGLGALWLTIPVVIALFWPVYYHTVMITCASVDYHSSC
jgi:hypothetical protein